MSVTGAAGRPALRATGLAVAALALGLSGCGTTAGGSGGAAPAPSSVTPVAKPTGQAGELVTVSDDGLVISVDVPAAWKEVDGAGFLDEKGNVVNSISASPDLEGYRSDWSISGVAVSATVDGIDDYTPDEALDLLGEVPGSSCTLAGERELYSDGFYTGVFEYWNWCGGLNTDYVTIAATHNDGSHLIWIQLQLAEGDTWALDPIVGSFLATF